MANIFKELIPNLLKSAIPSAIKGIPNIFRKMGDSETAKRIEDAMSSEEFKLKSKELLLKEIEEDNEFTLKIKELELKEKEAELKDLDSARDLAKNDNLNGHHLSKIIRPLSALVMISLFIFCVLTVTVSGVILIFNNSIDSSQMNELIKLAESIMDYIKVPLVIILGFFFGSRHLEKKTNIITKKGGE